MPDKDTELTLTRGDLRLVVSPYGASLRGLTRSDATLIAGYSGADNKKGGQGDVLIPFPGRIAEGRYTFDGQTYQMERNDKDGPNAIHGFVRSLLWDYEEPTAEEVTFTVNLHAQDYAPRGYPFSLGIRVTYHLTDDGMACAFVIENTGDTPAPAAAGFHPYFTAGSPKIDADTLELPFASMLEFNDVLIPTGKILPLDGTPYDFRRPHPIGDLQINTCYLDPQRDADGHLKIRLTAPDTGRAVTVWMDRAFDYVVLYSGDPLPEPYRRQALAIEPMTCAADAFNHPEWGLRALAPGETLSGSWGVTDRA